MPIFDQGYQHWNGRLSGHAWRWLAVADEGVRAQMARKGSKWLIIAGFSPALALAVMLIIWGLLEQQSSLLEPFQFLLRGLPEEIRSGPRAYRSAFWTLAFDFFFRSQTLFAMLLVLQVGPDLISQDLRFNAMPLYFSRPLRRIDYFLGKLGVIAFFLGAVVVLPAVAAYVLGVAFSFEVSVFRDTGRLFLGALGFGAVIVVSAGALMLALSSLSRNSRWVSASWCLVCVMSWFAAEALRDSIGEEGFMAVSYAHSLGRVRESMLGTVAARDQFLRLVEKAREAAQAAARAAGPFGGFGGRRRGPVPPALSPGAAVEPPLLLRLQSDVYPWTWSAAVLTGLFGLSALILATRVKSLDRLR